MPDAPTPLPPAADPSAYELPLFPLPLVLFPGSSVPLHVFEPRYRQLLADVRPGGARGDGRFGILLTAGGPERALPAGRAGCVAHVRDVEVLPDGRANLVVDGGDRFTLVRFVERDAPYHVAEVAPLHDAPDAAGPHQLRMAAARVRDLFDRVARAARAIADDPAPVPPLPDEPAAVAFAVAARVEFELATRQELLASRSALARLDTVEELLGRAAPTVEERAVVHERARGNGHGLTHGPGA